jgi:YebC/PmpR family DNA-binding regulatory protein
MGRAFEYRKARKFKRWGMMAKTFTKIGREISAAVKDGGPSPEANGRLRAAIQNAKAAQMPKENIERAIKKAISKEEADFEEVVYEGYGPHGIAIVVECLTNNTLRTVANVRSYFNRSGGSLGTSGSLDFVFERKCHFKIEDNGLNLEELEFELIDLGGDEVFKDDEGKIVIYGGPKDFKTIQQYLEEKKLEIISSGFERLPLDTKELNPEQQAEIEKLLEKFEEDEDVQNVYHSMA